jgi:hypothetical protein
MQYNATLHYSATLCGKVAFYGNLELQNMATFNKSELLGLNGAK